jgi:very-short-patch-repair endonuclease
MQGELSARPRHRVVRVVDDDVYRNLNGVVETILAAITQGAKS